MANETGRTVESYYDLAAERELSRLAVHRMEHAITTRALRQYLPAPPAVIADIGGGPGRYAVELAEAGYNVTLVDLSRRLLHLARQFADSKDVALDAYIHGNALDLSALPGDTFDAVLLLGPLYHLLLEEERRRALGEACRLLHDGGILFAAFITRYAPVRNMAQREPDAIVRDRALLEHALVTGQHHSAANDRFTDAYFAHPAEIVPLLDSCGFTFLDLIACEGVVSRIDQGINELQGEGWDAWVDVNYRLAHDPSVHGAAEHLLYAGKKTEPAL
ncbi:MAG TPA: class I SAM-dependent methyltransferase [Chloroflexota bacterium]|nr:class I SAM-dependent methyltransferase [Chloroflexota bacterium]